MIKLLLTALAIYCAIAALVYAYQRKLQYFPDVRMIEPADVGLEGFRSVSLDTADGERLVAWYAPAEPAEPTLVYFHGNAEAIAAREERFALFRRTGYGVLALSYRGYGGSTGSPSEEGLLEDGRAALRWLRQQGVPNDGMVLYGESLGTGVAVQLAADDGFTPAAMVLEAPFTSAAAVARRAYWYLPVDLLMKDQFRSIDHADGIEVPTVVFHGDRDTVIPMEQGRALYERLGGRKEFIVLEGATHVAPLTAELWQRIDAFVRSHLP